MKQIVNQNIHQIALHLVFFLGNWTVIENM